MKIEQIPHSSGPKSFGATVSGVDFAKPLGQEAAAEIDAAIQAYAVLVFHGANLGDDQLVRFARSFGPTHRSVSMMTRDPNVARVNSELTDTSNLSADHKPFPRGDARRANNLGARRWHTDGSYQDPIGKYSMLSARRIPAVGGDTEFADMRAAYDALPEALKLLIDDHVAEHSFFHARAQIGFELTEKEKSQKPVRHPIVRRHPITGRKSLYIGTPASHIIGWPGPEGKDLLHELLDRATQRQFVYAHKWSVGDLVMWNNHVTLHRGRRHYPESEPRDMRRATVAEIENAAELLD